VTIAPPPGGWSLVLYVSGASSRSAAAIETARSICDEDLAGDAELRIVDVSEHPELASSAQIVAVPTLVRHLPTPKRSLVGDLHDADRVRAGLGLALVTTAPDPSTSADR
jgi:circadian clock protein KaiB